MYFGEGRIEGGRFTGACRSGDENHSVRLPDHLAQAFYLTGRHSQGFQGQPPQVAGNALLVKNSDDGIFTESAWHDGHPKVYGLVAKLNLKPTILRNAALRNI